MRTPLPLSVRFWRLAAAPPTRHPGHRCWGWHGNKNQVGYGQFRVGRKGRVMSAHRVSWEIHNGPIPEGLIVMHSCDNPGCVNPAHLMVGTQKENLQDAARKGRLSAPQAKPYRPHTRVRKLTDDQVRAIRADDRPIWKVAAEHGVAETTIWGIRSRRRKALVPDLPEGVG